MARKNDRRTLGMRITEGFLPIFGPAQVGRQDADGRGVSDAERIPPSIVAATGLTLDELAEVHAAASKVVAAALRAGVY